MRQLVGLASAVALIVLTAPWAKAHHGFGTFDMNKDVEITGVVTGLDFVNPHSWLYLDVTQPDGKVVAMRCEMRSATTLRRSGWSPDLFPKGKKVTITGSPDREDPYSCYVSTVIFDDGSRLDRYGQIVAPAQIGQGQRPERLANGQSNISGDWAVEQRVMTDPRGQIGTLVPLSEAEKIRASGNLEARGVLPGARTTDGNAAGGAGARGGGARGRAGGAPNRGGGAGRRGGGPGDNLTAAGRAALAARPPAGRFAMSCVFTSIVAEWGGEPVNRITQRGDTITIQYGRLGVSRTVHMNMTEHPKNIEPSLTGHSIGRWEGDVLVVDTVGFAPGMLNGRTPHSDRLHVVERFSFDPKTRQLRRDYVAEDPLFLTKPLTGSTVMDMSNVPYDAEPCEDLTIDEDAKLGPRG